MFENSNDLIKYNGRDINISKVSDGELNGFLKRLLDQQNTLLNTQNESLGQLLR